jgi:hypothetical protein
MKAKAIVEANLLITTGQAAELLGMTERNVRILCAAGKIPGAVKLGHIWAVPNPPKVRDPFRARSNP